MCHLVHSQDRLDAVERLKRKEEFARALQRQRLIAVDRKQFDAELSKIQSYDDRMRIKQEIHLQDEVSSDISQNIMEISFSTL